LPRKTYGLYIKKLGPANRPCFLIFLLPVGLADVMERDAKAKSQGRQQEILKGVAQVGLKKTAPFQWRGQFDREEVSPNTVFRAIGNNDSGTEALTMYFA
jgi:hypothetical protein